MRSHALLKLATVASIWRSFPSVNNIGVHALPVHASDVSTGQGNGNSDCQDLSLSDPLLWTQNPCFSKRLLPKSVETTPSNDPVDPSTKHHALVARAPRFMMMPKPRPNPKPKPSKPGPGSSDPDAPGSGTPGALQPGVNPGGQNQAPNSSPERLTGDTSPNAPKGPDSAPQNQAPDNAPERLTGDEKPSPKPEDNPDQKLKDDKKDEEMNEPMLMEPMPPPASTTDPGAGDPSQHAPLTNNPSSDPSNNQERPSDADVAKQTEGIWKVDNGPGALVTPKQITDTMAATANLKRINQRGTWWSSSGIDIDESIRTNPQVVQNINNAIVTHKSGSSPAAQVQKRQSAQNATQNAPQMPASMRDVVPDDARKHWHGMDAAGDGAQAETSDRMRYAYATWIQGDNFYVISKPGVDVGGPNNADASPEDFASFELPYITSPRASAGGKDPFQAVYRVDLKPDGTAMVDPKPIWTTGQGPAGQPFTKEWMQDGQA